MNNALYIYFISFAHNKGFGNAEVEMKEKVNGLDDLSFISDKLIETGKYKEVVVINYILMRVINKEAEKYE